MSCTSPAPWWRTPSKRRFDRRFGPLIFLTAPNQHRPLPDLRREPGNIGPSPLPAVSSHIHSKTACRGASACRWHASYEPTGAERRPSPSAPAKNSATAFAVALFFVMAVGETEARGACRASPPKRRLWRMQRGGDGAAVGDWQGGPAAADRAGHRKRACEASSSPSLHFRHVMGELPSLSLLYSVLSHPTSPVLNLPHPLQHPKRTRFRLFLAFPGAFRCFCPLLTCKIFGSVFVHPAA